MHVTERAALVGFTPVHVPPVARETPKLSQSPRFPLGGRPVELKRLPGRVCSLCRCLLGSVLSAPLATVPFLSARD